MNKLNADLISLFQRTDKKYSIKTILAKSLIKYLEVATFSHNWMRTNNHDGQDNDQQNSSYISKAPRKSKYTRLYSK